MWKKVAVLTGLALAGVGCGGGNSGNGGGVSCASPQVITSGDVNGGVQLEKGCYLAEDDLTVNDSTLRLMPGVTIQFDKDVGLDINNEGRLNAEGTEDEPITLTGTDETRGFWQGIRFENSNSDDNVLRHVTLEFAGSKQWTGGPKSMGGIFTRDTSKVTIANSTFRENANAALQIREKTTLEVSDSTFVSNANSIRVTARQIGGIKSGNTFEENDNSYIRVAANSTPVEVTRAATWRSHPVPYRVFTGASIRADVTVEPGTTFAFAQDRGFSVGDGGSLNADASGGESITFTGAEKIKGFWKGLGYYSKTTDNVLANVVVEYGGSDNWTGGSNSVANVFLRGSTGPKSRVEISETTLRGSGKHGIAIQEGSQIAGCNGLTFENNDGLDTWVQGSNQNTPSCLSN